MNPKATYVTPDVYAVEDGIIYHDTEHGPEAWEPHDGVYVAQMSDVNTGENPEENQANVLEPVQGREDTQNIPATSLAPRQAGESSRAAERRGGGGNQIATDRLYAFHVAEEEARGVEMGRHIGTRSSNRDLVGGLP